MRPLTIVPSPRSIGTALQVPKICSAELRDLEDATSRPLSQAQAQRFRLRRFKEQLVTRMLGDGR